MGSRQFLLYTVKGSWFYQIYRSVRDTMEEERAVERVPAL